jgi:hypothetical protein
MAPRTPAPRRHRLLAAVALTLAATLAAGDALAQWVWRDRNGQVHASDRPPPRDVPERDIVQRPAAAPAPRAAPAPAPAADAPTAAGTPARVDPELEARRRAAEQQQQARQRQEAAQAEAQAAQQRAENCERARAQLRQLDSGMRIARVNERGERIIIDDAERAAEAQRARQVVASDC